MKPYVSRACAQRRSHYLWKRKVYPTQVSPVYWQSLLVGAMLSFVGVYLVSSLILSQQDKMIMSLEFTGERTSRHDLCWETFIGLDNNFTCKARCRTRKASSEDFAILVVNRGNHTCWAPQSWQDYAQLLAFYLRQLSLAICLVAVVLYRLLPSVQE